LSQQETVKNSPIVLEDYDLKQAWQNPEQYTPILQERVDIYFTHPYQFNMQSTIKPIRDIYSNTLQWANANPGKLREAARYQGSVEHARKELEGLAEKSTMAVDYMIKLYRDY